MPRQPATKNSRRLSDLCVLFRELMGVKNLDNERLILDGKMNLYFGISNPSVDPGMVRSLDGGKGQEI